MKEMPGAQTPWTAINQLLAPDERFEIHSSLSEQKQLLLAPKHASQLSALFYLIKQQGIPFSIQGKGSTLHYENSELLILSSRAFTHLLWHEPGIIEAGAGCPLLQIHQFLFQNNQETILEEDPLSDPKRSIGGILLSGRTSGLRLHGDLLSDSILGVEFVGFDGSLIKWGGAHRSALGGPSWHKLLLGLKSFPGMIIKVYLKTYPIPSSRLRLSWSFDRDESLREQLTALKAVSHSWEYLESLHSGNPGDKRFIFAQIAGLQEEMNAFSKHCPQYSVSSQTGQRMQLKKYLMQQNLNVYSADLDQPLKSGEYCWTQEGNQNGWWLTKQILDKKVEPLPVWQERFYKSLSE